MRYIGSFILLLCFLCLRANAQGLEFNTYESETIQKTSYSVFDENPLTFKGHFSISYDLAIQDYGSFGYIFRLKDLKRENADIYSFVFSYDNDERSYLKFNIEAKTVARKGHFVVYIKEGEGIVDVLNVMEAPVALMEMENVRILKGMSNYYNRQVNCETANIKKTVTTACRQIDDINYIIENEGLEYLPDKLQDIATLRVENPDASLQELGQMLEPQLGKSGVNHRLRKICQIAEEIRGIPKEERL